MRVPKRKSSSYVTIGIPSFQKEMEGQRKPSMRKSEKVNEGLTAYRLVALALESTENIIHNLSKFVNKITVFFIQKAADLFDCFLYFILYFLANVQASPSFSELRAAAELSRRGELAHPWQSAAQ